MRGDPAKMIAAPTVKYFPLLQICLGTKHRYLAAVTGRLGDLGLVQPRFAMGATPAGSVVRLHWR